MLLRICLIVVIIAGLATAAISRFKVAEKISTLTFERDDYRQKMETSMENERQARSEASKTKKELELTKKDLTTATNELAIMTAKKDEQEERANKHAADLEETRMRFNETQQKLARWAATGLEPEAVIAAMAEKRKVQDERDAFASELDVFTREQRRLEAELAKYKTPNAKVPMKPGLKGKIIAVDPKWQFVIVDVGSEHGAVPRGEMVVSRTGKLVAKIKLTTVDQTRSVANILPEWKQAEVTEGDQAFYFHE